MKMTEAMKACAIGGCVYRKAYPILRYYKNPDGRFPDAVNVSYLDFTSTDWQHSSAEDAAA